MDEVLKLPNKSGRFVSSIWPVSGVVSIHDRGQFCTLLPYRIITLVHPLGSSGGIQRDCLPVGGAGQVAIYVNATIVPASEVKKKLSNSALSSETPFRDRKSTRLNS